MSNKPWRVLIVALLTLLVAGSFTELGIWQLHRAQEVQRLNKPGQDKPAVEIHSLTSAGSNLTDNAINRLVTLTGKYIKSYDATYQEALVDGRKQVISLSVGLLQLSSTTTPAEGILVVRGIGDIPGARALPTGEVSISGRLYPRQTTDHSITDSSNLGRLDPALVAGINGLNLFDGYVVAIGEKSSEGSAISYPRIGTPVAKPTTPGFYWQHISYVFIWWFMALLVLIAPFYNARLNRRSQQNSEIG